MNKDNLAPWHAGDIGYLPKLVEVTGVKFRLTPADYMYSWHNAPNQQFIVNLDADVEVVPALNMTSEFLRVTSKGKLQLEIEGDPLIR